MPNKLDGGNGSTSADNFGAAGVSALVVESGDFVFNEDINEKHLLELRSSVPDEFNKVGSMSIEKKMRTESMMSTRKRRHNIHKEQPGICGWLEGKENDPPDTD